MLHQVISPSDSAKSFSIADSETTRRKTEVRAKIASEFMRLDPFWANWFLGSWKKFTQSIQDVRSLKFEDLDAYLAFRVVDAAAMYEHLSTLSLRTSGTND